MKREKVGFIGLGIMGLPMARNLLEADHSLVVFNRTAARCAELASEGAVVAGSPAEVAATCPVVITIVSDSEAVQEVIAGGGGVADGIQAGSIVVDMSTISPHVERELDALLRKKGAELVDAPVSGGDVGARNATLAIMVGGSDEAVARVRPIFDVLGKTITHCGPVGNGQLTKLSNQILVSVNLLGVCEAIAFARNNGLSATTMIEAVQGGAAGSWQLANLGPRIAAGDFDPGFMVDLMQKDLRLVLESAAARTGLPATALVHQLFSALQARGGGRDGTQALARVVDSLGR